MEEQDTSFTLLDDSRFFEKENFVFTKCWGILPDIRKSVNANTESNTTDVKKFLDPLANRISLDLIEENVGEVDSRMVFRENSLFKLNSLQVPAVLSKEVVVGSNYTELNEEDHNLLKLMHEKHMDNDYTILVYVDEVMELLTLPNSKYSASNGAFSFRHQFFQTVGDKSRNFGNRFDQRVTLQLYPGLLEKSTAYDLKSFKYQALQRNHARNRVGDKNKLNSVDVTSPKLVLKIIQQNENGVFAPIDKNEFTETYNVSDLAKEVNIEYKVLNMSKLFKGPKNQTRYWGYELIDLTNNPKDKDKWEQLISLEIASGSKYSLSQINSSWDRVGINRFYTRFKTNYGANVNAVFNSKLSKHNQFLSYTSSKMPDKGKTYVQMAHGKEILDGGANFKIGDWDGDAELKPEIPPLRIDRMLSAYNKTTGEICVQFLPLIQDEFKIPANIQKKSVLTEADVTTNYQTWFFKVARAAEKYMSTRSPLIGGVKRRIFAIYAEDNLKNKKQIKYADPPVWNVDTAPLMYLHIKYERPTSPSASGIDVNADKLKGIKIKFYYNVEKLGFDLYGASDALYCVERFFREFVTFHEMIYDSYVSKSVQSQTLRTNYRGQSLDLFTGEWIKSSIDPDADKSKFGKTPAPAVLKVINMRDEVDIVASVRVKALQDLLKAEDVGRWKRIKTFLNANLTSKQKAESQNVRGNYFNYTHRCRLVFLPSLRESDSNRLPPNLSGDDGERLGDFGLDKLTSNQKKRVIEFHKELLQMMKPTSSSGSFTDKHSFHRAPAYFGVTIGKENVGGRILGGSDFKQASYAILMMSGTEFDVVQYENYVIEPCEGIKELFLLTETDANKEHRLMHTKNYDKKRKKYRFKNHPMYDSQLGLYSGSPTKGSFWQFPMIAPKNGKMNLQDYFDFRKSSFDANPSQGDKRTFNMKITVDDKNRKRFLSEYDLIRFRRGKLAVGGKLTNSSIRVEAPDFLENSYCSSEQFFQEHAKFTLSNSGLSDTDSHKERKRLRTHDLSDVSRPQPIKRRKFDSIEMHFFLSDGTRPRQKKNGDLTDVGRSGIEYAPVRNVDCTVYAPKFNKRKFEYINKNTFLADEVVKMSGQSKSNVDNLKLLVSLHNIYKTERRLTSSFGKTNSPNGPNKVQESIEESGEFYRRLFEIWTTVENGNKTFKLHFNNLSRSKMLSGPIRQFFLSSQDDKKPFEMRVLLEEVVMPLHVKNLKNDDTIIILTDFDFSPSETTNFNGSIDKKVLAKIDLKSIADLDKKMESGFIQTFTVGSGVSGAFKSNSIKVVRIHDVRSYKLFFTNSDFEPIQLEQAVDPKITGNDKYVSDNINVTLKFFITNKLKNV